VIGGCAALSVAEQSARIAVTARVMPIARAELQGNPPRLTVTAADLARGFIDSPEALRLQVYSNSAGGYVLDVLPVSPVFRGMVVDGFDGSVSLPAAGGTVVQRWQHAQTVSLQLRFRFDLAPDVAPGDYDWPVRLMAHPL
jgi:hypothetical protein